MVCDSFTQYNEAGIGVSISNNGYAQLVSIFTIGCEIGIGVSSGGQCDLTNSNSSFGIKGLVADGFGDFEFTGITTNGPTDAQSDAVVTANTKDVDGNKFNSEASELLAVCIQHEIDHLDGKIFVDYLSDMKRSKIEKGLTKQKNNNTSPHRTENPYIK